MSELTGNLDDQRRFVGAPPQLPRAAALKYGLGGVALTIGTILLEIGLHGLDVEAWGAVSSS